MSGDAARIAAEALAEDGDGDVTTAVTVPDDSAARARGAIDRMVALGK